jgi:hypothetical protein
MIKLSSVRKKFATTVALHETDLCIPGGKTTILIGATQGKTFYGFSRDLLRKLFAVSCFELEHPGTVFDLIKVV